MQKPKTAPFQITWKRRPLRPIKKESAKPAQNLFTQPKNMGKNSAIQWTDATWNVARGCSKVDEDCKFCYMYRDSMGGHRYDPLEVVKTKGVFTFPLKYKATTSEAWDGRPLIFTSSLTDWGHEAIDSYRHEIWQQVKQCPHLIFQMLTKRIGRGNAIFPEDWGNGYENVWLGTSIGSEEAIERAYQLAELRAEVKFLSLEPLHGRIDFSKFLLNNCSLLASFDWVIVGGESGNDVGKYRYRPAELEWIHLIVDQCKALGIPVFVKQLGTHLAKQCGLHDRHGGDLNEWPTPSLKVREFPKVY